MDNLQRCTIENSVKLVSYSCDHPHTEHKKIMILHGSNCVAWYHSLQTFPEQIQGLILGTYEHWTILFRPNYLPTFTQSSSIP